MAYQLIGKPFFFDLKFSTTKQPQQKKNRLGNKKSVFSFYFRNLHPHFPRLFKRHNTPLTPLSLFF